MKAKKGDTVKVHYAGTLDDGRVFDSSEGREPLEFNIGEGKVIKGFDRSVEGMGVNEEKDVHIECKDAYGEADEKLYLEMPKPKNVELKKGAILVMQSADGRKMPAKVAEIKGEIIVVDFNHPLAGKDLNFKIKLVEIVKK